MSELPPIPQAAIDAAQDYALVDNNGDIAPQSALRAAYPHLAAAVLRWAAEQMPDPFAFIERHAMSTTPGVGPVLSAVYADLRRLADEATP